jgi:hypothetical protein
LPRTFGHALSLQAREYGLVNGIAYRSQLPAEYRKDTISKGFCVSAHYAFTIAFVLTSLDKLNVSIVSLIAGSITIIGWFVTKALERRQKRIEFRRAYIQQQIEDFYGPLYSLIWQLFSSRELQQRISDRCQLSSAEQESVRQYFFEKHFFPLHQRITQILDSKLYLLDGAEMPLSVYEYLKHSQQEDIQRELWMSYSISTTAVVGTPFPNAFYKHVQDTLKKLMREYEVSVEQLKSGTSATDKALAKQAEEERRLMQRISDEAA